MRDRSGPAQGRTCCRAASLNPSLEPLFCAHESQRDCNWHWLPLRWSPARRRIKTHRCAVDQGPKAQQTSWERRTGMKSNCPNLHGAGHHRHSHPASAQMQRMRTWTGVHASGRGSRCDAERCVGMAAAVHTQSMYAQTMDSAIAQVLPTSSNSQGRMS
jgi:hypothetical protein